MNTVLNLRTSIAHVRSAPICIRADNLTGTWVEPQISVPGPGRTLRGGMAAGSPCNSKLGRATLIERITDMADVYPAGCN
jgi:hypothetical protein